MTPELLRGLEPLFTVHSHSPTVKWAVAPLGVRKAFVSDTGTHSNSAGLDGSGASNRIDTSFDIRVVARSPSGAMSGRGLVVVRPSKEKVQIIGWRAIEPSDAERQSLSGSARAGACLTEFVSR